MMTSPTQCPFCHVESQSFQKTHGRLRDDYPAAVYECTQCSFEFLHPRLSEAEQTAFYKGDYRVQYDNVPVYERFVTDAPEALSRLKRILGEAHPQQTLLEIGSGSGAFLAFATAYFKNAVGIELDQPAQRFMREKNLTVHETLNQIKTQQFDWIVLFHVLEHILDPVAFLKELSSHLAPSGKIVIEVPNSKDALVSYYQNEAFKDFYYCSAHVSYFSQKTLQACLAKAHLQSEISFIQRYDFSNHLNWMINRRPGGLPSEKKIFSEATQSAYIESLIQEGCTDTLWAIAHF